MSPPPSSTGYLHYHELFAGIILHVARTLSACSCDRMFLAFSRGHVGPQPLSAAVITVSVLSTSACLRLGNCLRPGDIDVLGEALKSNESLETLTLAGELGSVCNGMSKVDELNGIAPSC
eukprot:4098598-Pleurochrysis_carterae.AAC.1